MHKHAFTVDFKLRTGIFLFIFSIILTTNPYYLYSTASFFHSLRSILFQSLTLRPSLTSYWDSQHFNSSKDLDFPSLPIWPYMFHPFCFTLFPSLTTLTVSFLLLPQPLAQKDHCGIFCDTLLTQNTLSPTQYRWCMSQSLLSPSHYKDYHFVWRLNSSRISVTISETF